MVTEWTLSALINGDYMGIIPLDALRVAERADDESDKRFIGCQDDLADALTGALWLDKEDRNEVLFRHNIAGDMAVVGTDKFDLASYLSIVSAIMTANYRLKVAGSSKHIKAFTYTHCDYDFYDRGSMRLMQDYMLVNISCETVDEAITEKEYGLNVVLTSINPEEDIAALKAKGIPAVQCPHRPRESPARSVVFAPETGNPWYSLKPTARAKERPVG